MTTDKQHRIDMEVRDYECDMADGVNNSVYFNYLEHARHSMLKGAGIDFAELARKRTGLVVLKAELDFLTSLLAGDHFYVVSRLYRVSRIRFEFQQHIFRSNDDKPVLKARILGVAVNENDRPGMPKDLEPLIMAICSEKEAEPA